MQAVKPHKPRKIPTQKRALDTVNIIFEAAAQVFAEQGYARTTTDRIAERAGISIGSLYQYFPNKESIAIALMENHSQEVRKKVLDALQIGIENDWPLKKMIRHSLDAVVASHESNPQLYRVLMDEVPRPPHFDQEHRQSLEQFNKLIASKIDQHPGRSARSPGITTQFITIAIQSMVHWYICYHHEDMDREEFLDEMTLMLCRYRSPNDEN